VNLHYPNDIEEVRFHRSTAGYAVETRWFHVGRIPIDMSSIVYDRWSLMIYRLQSGALLLVCLCIFLVDPAFSDEASRMLDGKAFVGKNGEKGQPLDPDEDEKIVFENGRFTSVSCEPYNFGSSEYSVKVVGDRIHFEAVTESPTHGKIAWKGIVDGDEAEMTFVWTKERWYWDTRREYWFRGALEE
jgi:hypothetical protein